MDASPQLSRVATAFSQAKTLSTMAIKDDPDAKFEIWAKERKVFPLPKMILPFHFPPRRFQSYEEMNIWKQNLLLEIARRGGVKWTN